MWHLHNANFVTRYENFPLQSENFRMITVTKDMAKSLS